MHISEVDAPTRPLGKPGKFFDVWDALNAADPGVGLKVECEGFLEAISLASAASSKYRADSGKRARTSRRGNTVILWLEPRTAA